MVGRAIYIARPGHSEQTDLEMRVAFSVLIERLDTGEWPDVSAQALNQRAEDMAAGMDDIADTETRFVDFEPVPPLRVWDLRDFGTYRPQ